MNRFQILVLVARWDELEGPILTQFLPKPNRLVDDPTDISTQAFMSSQSIFGDENFERTLVTMPFIQYNCKAKIQFDYKESESTRGGRNPFLVGIFVSEDFDSSLFTEFENELRKFMIEERGKPEDQINLERLLQNLSGIYQASEAKIAFSTFSDNWAILTDGSDILWKFGPLDEKTSSLISSLSVQLTKIAAEEGAMSIRFMDQRRRPPKEIEIFTLVFHNQFYLIASNPDISSRLLRVSRESTGESPDLVCGVLSAQAVDMYAGLWTDDSESVQAIVDRIFEEALEELGIHQLGRDQPRAYAKKGECNFAALDLAELFFLHWYLRMRFTIDLSAETTEPWAIIFDSSGLMFTSYNKEDALVLSGYLGSIFSFFTHLFRSIPQKIVFGVRALTYIEILEGENYFLASNNPKGLFMTKGFGDFIKKELPENVLKDLEGPIKNILSDIISSNLKESLFDKSISTLMKDISKKTSPRRSWWKR